MGRYRRKLLGLAMVCAIMPAWLLQCDEAALDLQRGFWHLLSINGSGLLLGVTTK